jgi:hypothetical protein
VATVTDEQAAAILADPEVESDAWEVDSPLAIAPAAIVKATAPEAANLEGVDGSLTFLFHDTASLDSQNNNAVAWAFARMSAADAAQHNGYSLDVTYNGTTEDYSLCRLSRVDDGDGVELDTATIAKADGHYFKLTVTGASLKVYQSSDGVVWTEILSATDDTYADGRWYNWWPDIEHSYYTTDLGYAAPGTWDNVATTVADLALGIDISQADAMTIITRTAAVYRTALS